MPCPAPRSPACVRPRSYAIQWDQSVARPTDYCPLDEPHCAASSMCAYYPQFHARVCAELRPRYGDTSTSVEVSLKELGMGAQDVLIAGFGAEYTDPADIGRTVELLSADIAHASLCVRQSGAPRPCLMSVLGRSDDAAGVTDRCPGQFIHERLR